MTDKSNDIRRREHGGGWGGRGRGKRSGEKESWRGMGGEEKRKKRLKGEVRGREEGRRRGEKEREREGNGVKKGGTGGDQDGGVYGKRRTKKGRIRQEGMRTEIERG